MNLLKIKIPLGVVVDLQIEAKMKAIEDFFEINSLLAFSVHRVLFLRALFLRELFLRANFVILYFFCAYLRAKKV